MANPTDTSKIALVAPDVWKPIVTDVLTRLDSSEHNLTYSILSSLHSRHVGITPELAAEAAQAFLVSAIQREVRRPPQTTKLDDILNRNPWTIALSKLRKVVALQRPAPAKAKGANSPRQAMPYSGQDGERPLGLLPHTALHYMVFEIISPLVVRACSSPSIPKVLLFCEDNDRCQIRAKQSDKYTTYADELKKQILNIVEMEDDDLMNLFWRDRAFTLLSITRSHGHAHHSFLPETTLPDARIFLDLEPSLSPGSGKSQSLDLSRLQKLFDPRWSSPGADAAKPSLRPEDLVHRLPSELIYTSHPIIMLDRLINSGFWVIKQPPKPVQTRDVLIAAICPHEIAMSPIGTFVKTCWFDFAMHLSRMLQHNGLRSSEIRWIEGDNLERVRTHSLLVKDLPDILSRMPDAQQGTYRYHFLKASGWFPTYLDPASHFKSLPQRPAAENGAYAGLSPEQTIGWHKAAWNSQREFIGWQQRAPQPLQIQGALPSAFDQQKLRVEHFTFIYVMFFLPSDFKTENESARTEQARREYRTFAGRFHDAHSISMTWVPSQIHDIQQWRFDGDQFHDTHLLPNLTNFSIHNLAGQLIFDWLSDFIGEIQGG